VLSSLTDLDMACTEWCGVGHQRIGNMEPGPTPRQTSAHPPVDCRQVLHRNVSATHDESRQTPSRPLPLGFGFASNFKHCGLNAPSLVDSPDRAPNACRPPQAGSRKRQPVERQTAPVRCRPPPSWRHSARATANFFFGKTGKGGQGCGDAPALAVPFLAPHCSAFRPLGRCPLDAFRKWSSSSCCFRLAFLCLPFVRLLFLPCVCRRLTGRNGHVDVAWIRRRLVLVHGTPKAEVGNSTCRP